MPATTKLALLCVLSVVACSTALTRDDLDLLSRQDLINILIGPTNAAPETAEEEKESKVRGMRAISLSLSLSLSSLVTCFFLSVPYRPSISLSPPSLSLSLSFFLFFRSYFLPLSRVPRSLRDA